MAETCIVCLGDLVPHDEGHVATTTTTTTITTDISTALAEDGVDSAPHLSTLPQVESTPSDQPPKDEDMVAHLLPCGHNLHNECLKPWVERANSCPICRANFNMVELSARIGGSILSSYAVHDKQQVADVDPSMIVEDDYLLEDDGSYDACMVCDEFGDSSQLMYCHSCEQLCHVFCAGLDRMPARGAWYCQGCIENPSLLQAANHRSTPRCPAAYVNGESRTRRRPHAPDQWVGVWQSVWDRLHFDIDFPFEDDSQSESRSEIQRRENQAWERRFELARSMGAGTRFRAAADNIAHRTSQTNRSRPINRALHREAPKTPRDPESQEELRAWNAFDKARDQIAGDEGQQLPANPESNNRRRKRKSVDSTPTDPETEEPEPKRKLKRPRTRLHLDTAESSATAARRSTLVPQMSPPAAISVGGDPTGPGFLQSILQEVAVDRFAEDREIAAPQPKRIIVERACSPQDSSPGLSPVYPTPHGMSTPPPLNLSRADFPAQQEQQSPTYSPYSPADEETRPGRKKLVRGQRSPGLSSPPRSKDSSPSRPSSLSYSTKAELQRMVTAVLKPFYAKKEISKDDYTEINRDVSRLLYDQVGEAGADALANQDTRNKWQKMANDAVDDAIKGLSTNRLAASPIGEDSASSSS